MEPMPPHPRQAVLEGKIAKLKAELMTLGDLQPGSLSEQYNVCGTAGCHCKADPPRKHGPYYQVSFTWQGRSKSQFVRREHVTTVRQHLRNYQRLRALDVAFVSTAIAWKKARRDCRSQANGQGVALTTPEKCERFYFSRQKLARPPTYREPLATPQARDEFRRLWFLCLISPLFVPLLPSRRAGPCGFLLKSLA